MTLLTPVAQSTILPDNRQRLLLLARREALLIELKAIEEYLDIPRSVKPHAERKREEWQERV
jgi:hypothetical protein